MPERLRAAGGDLAKMALDAKLVDKLAPRDEVRQRMIELVGEDKEKKSFRQVGVADLPAGEGRRPQRAPRARATRSRSSSPRATSSTAPSPRGRSAATPRRALLRRAREDDAVKAVVLRVDSAGGSAFASEIIRRECELVRKAGKPLVVSMGSVAASGGYWISTASDEIWAAPETITGSIGIFGLFPTIDKPLAKYLGDPHRRRRHDALHRRPAAGPPPGPGAWPTSSSSTIDHGYQDFLARVAQARKMTPEQVDKIARGRIWSGEDAKGLGLVDQLGGLDQAIESAAKRAKLEKGYRVWYVEKEKSFRERLMSMLAAQALDVASGRGLGLRAFALGLRPLGGRAPAGAPGRRRAALPLERPARRLRPLPLRRGVKVRDRL